MNTWGYFVRSVSVSNWPAASAQSLMPWRAHSIASVLIMFSTAARAAPGVDHPGHAVVRREGDAQDLAAALRDERLGCRGMRHQPGSEDVQLDHRPESLRRDRLGRAQELAAGVVDEDVDSAVAIDHAIEHRVDRLVVADVHRLGLRRAAQRADGRRGFLDRLGAAPAADDGRSQAPELERGRPAKAGPGSRKRRKPARRAGRARRCGSARARPREHMAQVRLARHEGEGSHRGPSTGRSRAAPPARR